MKSLFKYLTNILVNKCTIIISLEIVFKKLLRSKNVVSILKIPVKTIKDWHISTAGRYTGHISTAGKQH